MPPTTNPETLTFPRVFSEHEPAASSIAIVGLIHVIPRCHAYMYHEVAEFAQAQLELPNSVVHYELTQSPTEQEALELKQRRPSTFEKLARIDELDEKCHKTLGFVHQTEALYDPYVTDAWKNYDLRNVDWAHQVHDDELDQEILEMESYYSEILGLSEQDRKLYNERNFMLDMVEAIEHNELAPFDRLREEHAVRAVLEELEQGTRHFTLLWGLAHMANFETAFLEHGYRVST